MSTPEKPEARLELKAVLYEQYIQPHNALLRVSYDPEFRNWTASVSIEGLARTRDESVRELADRLADIVTLLRTPSA